MKCINKRFLSIVSVLVISLSLTSCKTAEDVVTNEYNAYENSHYSFDYSAESSSVDLFTSGLCVTGTDNSALDNTDYQVCGGGAGLFNLTSGNVNYSYNIFEKLYPASTTKILTCYIAATASNLDDMVTVSENAVNQASDSSTCGLKAGDVISMRDLLYGLMLRSGNDAAVAIAEHISGSTEAFAELMNQTAASLGATNSHFTNPNGLPDENHYTTIYDMYLILNRAITVEEFLSIFTASAHTASYTTSTGEPFSQDWVSTNKYLIGEEQAPDGITVLGGKTGTTGDAGYCLVLLSKNANQDDLISIVYKADCRSNLYLMMNEMMAYYSN